jgi:hypothetical protein
MEKEENLLSSAVIALVAERKELAQRLLLHTISRNRTNQQAWLYLAVTLPRERAIEALQKVLVLNPQHKIALQNLMLLRHCPDLELTLDHVMEEPSLPAIFGEEPPTIPVETFGARAEKTKAYFNAPEFDKGETNAAVINTMSLFNKADIVNPSFSLQDVGISLDFTDKPKAPPGQPERVKPPPPQIRPRLSGGESADSSSELLTPRFAENQVPAYLAIKRTTRQSNQNPPNVTYPSYSSYYDDPSPSVPNRAVHYTPVNQSAVRLKERPVKRNSEPLTSGTGLTGLGMFISVVMVGLAILCIYLIYFVR